MQLTDALVREFVATGRSKRSKNVLTGQELSEKALKLPRANYRSFPEGAPLFGLNARKILLSPFTGVLITDREFAYATVPDTVWPWLILRHGEVRTLPLSEVTSFQIGKHDHCLGSAYVGHQLLVNGEVVGLVRMGPGIVYDDKAIHTINAFSTFLFERGELNQPPVVL